MSELFVYASSQGNLATRTFQPAKGIEVSTAVGMFFIAVIEARADWPAFCSVAGFRTH